MRRLLINIWHVYLLHAFTKTVDTWKHEKINVLLLTLALDQCLCKLATDASTWCEFAPEPHSKSYRFNELMRMFFSSDTQWFIWFFFFLMFIQDAGACVAPRQEFNLAQCMKILEPVNPSISHQFKDMSGLNTIKLVLYMCTLSVNRLQPTQPWKR